MYELILILILKIYNFVERGNLQRIIQIVCFYLPDKTCKFYSLIYNLMNKMVIT